ncbi:MAG: tryptophan-rich sensory protein [Clostridia bacterium]|nr:tryptophan-rich sensory protein [Clostridia bacterium]
MLFWKKRGRRICRRRIDLTAALICGLVVLLAGGMVRGICGGPWGTRGALQLGERLPSVALMTLFWSAWYFILGALFGAVMFDERFCGVVDLRTVAKYRGAAALLCMIVLSFLWYPLFFLAARFALSALLSALLTFLAVVAAVNYVKVSRVAGVILLLYAAILLIATICGIRLLFVT